MTTYDYWGYYNICYLAGEVEKPERNVPRAVMISIGLVAAIYLLMNVSVLGVIPWQQLQGQTSENARSSVIAVFMQQIYGGWAGKLVTLLIIWTAFGSVFSLLLGYSRVPYAAALDGNYFAVFGRLHPRHKFPHVSLLVMGSVAAAFCVLQLADVIAALVVIRILLQFLLQQVGLLILRRRHPEMPRPFRMWFYPAAGALCHRRIHLHPDFAAEFPARNSLRHCAAGRRAGALFRARLPARRMALGRRAER